MWQALMNNHHTFNEHIFACDGCHFEIVFIVNLLITNLYLYSKFIVYF